MRVSPIGFGAFKIGRNVGVKYPQSYTLPDVEQVARLLNGLLDAGVNYIDTAPAYGTSEKLIGQCIADRKSQFVLSTKVGETFNGHSTYDFGASAVRKSIERSLRQLRIDSIDLVFIHSHGDDLEVVEHTDVVPVLSELRQQGLVRGIGLSGKTVAGARATLKWADVIMVEYHLHDRSHEAVIAEAAEAGVGVICKKGLAAGHLRPEQAIPFVMRNQSISSMVIGSLNLEHFRQNMLLAEQSAS